MNRIDIGCFKMDDLIEKPADHLNRNKNASNTIVISVGAEILKPQEIKTSMENGVNRNTNNSILFSFGINRIIGIKAIILSRIIHQKGCSS